MSEERSYGGNSGLNSKARKTSKDSSKSVEDVEMEDQDIFSRTSLDLSNHAMPQVEGLAKTLSQFKKLQRLDMSGMKPSSDCTNGLETLFWLSRAAYRKKIDDESFGDHLIWLKIANNSSLGLQPPTRMWDGIEILSKLKVLNAASCALTCAPPTSALLQLSSLAALILAHNEIKTLTKMPHLPQLNTLVLSHNQIEQLPRDLAANVPSLKKLSVTHNLLEWKEDKCPLPNLTLCSHLREVRFSGNIKLKRLPMHLSTWGRGEGTDKLGTGLETLEAAECGLNTFDDVKAILDMVITTPLEWRRQRGLSNLVLKGNAVAKCDNYQEKLLATHTTLKTLDGERVQNSSIRKDGRKPVMGEDDRDLLLKSDRKKHSKKHASLEENLLSPAVEQKSISTEDSEIQKMRKRGKRGERGVKEMTTPRSADKLLQKRKKEKKFNISKKDTDEDNLVPSTDVARARNRAGPEPQAVSKNMVNISKTTKSIGPEMKMQKENKRKAWDEGSEGLPTSKAMKTDPMHIPPKPDRRDLTSVAAVVNLKKKEKEPKEILWGKLKHAEDQVGTGGGWL